MYSNISEAWANKPMEEITNKLVGEKITDSPESKQVFYSKQKNPNNHKFDDLTLSDISIKSDGDQSDFGPFAPAKFDRYGPRKQKYHTMDNTDSDFHLNGKCGHNIDHIKQCDRCYDNLKELINSRVSKKVDELMLDYKLKQLQNMVPPIQQPAITKNDSWKETLIIIVGILIALLIIFLIIKSVYK